MAQIVLDYTKWDSALEEVEHALEVLGVENGYTINKKGSSIVLDIDECYLAMLQKMLLGPMGGRA